MVLSERGKDEMFVSMKCCLTVYAREVRDEVVDVMLMRWNRGTRASLPRIVYLVHLLSCQYQSRVEVMETATIAAIHVATATNWLEVR